MSVDIGCPIAMLLNKNQRSYDFFAVLMGGRMSSLMSFGVSVCLEENVGRRPAHAFPAVEKAWIHGVASGSCDGILAITSKEDEGMSQTFHIEIQNMDFNSFLFSTIYCLGSLKPEF